MAKFPEKLVEFYDRLESEIVLAAGTARQRFDSLKRSAIPQSKILPNWLEQTAYAGYVALIEQRDRLHELFPDLRNRSKTAKDHELEYF
jgi:hypothetical protein